MFKKKVDIVFFTSKASKACEAGRANGANKTQQGLWGGVRKIVI